MMKTLYNRLNASLCVLLVLAFSTAEAQSTTPANPVSVPVEVSGVLYGTVTKGGASGYGAIWKYVETTGTFSILYSFDGTNGATPYGKLVYASDGYLYGTTSQGGNRPPGAPVPNGEGGVYRISPGGSSFSFYPIPYSVASPTDYGHNPNMGLVEDPVGASGTQRVFYGVTQAGGANDTGTIYQFAMSGGTGSFTKLYEFPTSTYNSSLYVYQNAIGTGPLCELVLQTTTGGRYLFGTANQAGPNGCGTVFDYGWSSTTSIASSATRSMSLVHGFGVTGLQYPGSGLTLTTSGSGATLGTMWGTAQADGDSYGSGGGGVYHVDDGSYGSEHQTEVKDTQYSSRGIQSGISAQTLIQPRGALCLGVDGLLYGTSISGGHMSTGVPPFNVAGGSIFWCSTIDSNYPDSHLNPMGPLSSNFSLVWTFMPESTPSLSQNPWSGIMYASDGYYYGVNVGGTPGGSPASNGAIYRFQAGTIGSVTLVHQF